MLSSKIKTLSLSLSDYLPFDFFSQHSAFLWKEKAREDTCQWQMFLDTFALVWIWGRQLFQQSQYPQGSCCRFWYSERFLLVLCCLCMLLLPTVDSYLCLNPFPLILFQACALFNNWWPMLSGEFYSSTSYITGLIFNRLDS